MATTLGNGLGPRTQICSMAKGTGDHTQADLDAVEKALGPNTHNCRCGRYNWYRPHTLQYKVQQTLQNSAGDYATDTSLTVVADFTD